MDRVMTELCEYLNNYFWRVKSNVHVQIKDGTFTDDLLKEGQYFRIIGSLFNDGVHIYPAEDLHDEDFEGSIWSMAVPKTVIDLASEIKAWREKYENVNSEAMSPFASESFGGYSYSKTVPTGSGSNPNDWKTVFASRLAPYRRLRGIE